MKAIIRIDVPEYQIGQEVSCYFKDTMNVKGICEAERTGHWIYTEYHTWCCSECGGNPHKGTGFVPNKDGMKMRWKYCNLCGAKMFEPHERSDKE